MTIEYRWAEGNPDRFPALAAELVQLKVDVIVLSGPPTLHAARRATSTIPVVFVVLADPIAARLVTNLARPGGNLTGLASQFEELITKQLQLLKEAVPTLSWVALLHHRESWPAILSAAETAARSALSFASGRRSARSASRPCDQIGIFKAPSQSDLIKFLPCATN